MVPEGIRSITEIAWMSDSSMCALLTSDLGRRARVILANVPDLPLRTLCTLDGGRASSPILVTPGR